ncbi:hypothetical protein G5I_09728 [Acromyrmex echinatior]|uniref:Uncharacterized protein n=1 Tax=Acromyrmex echinatior TaxID=103372 RepID=F4WUZ6_ACREC|nr:hypothetical protein G5I_09728 [Acromyrmex echinatior]
MEGAGVDPKEEEGVGILLREEEGVGILLRETDVDRLKVSASRMKNDFVHVAPSTGLTVCHSVTPIINDILDYLGTNFTQNSRNIMSSTNIPFSRTFLTNLRIAPSTFEEVIKDLSSV